MIDTFAQWAHRLYPRRRYFLAATLVTFTAMGWLMFMSPSHVVDIVGFVGLPIVTTSWGLLCMCVWFDPEHGNLQRGWLVSRMPRPLVAVLRWYFGAFLALWFFIGIVGVPAFALWGEKFIGLTTRSSGQDSSYGLVDTPS